MSAEQYPSIWGDRDYLDTVTGIAGVQAYKRRTYAALRPQPGARLLDAGCGPGDDVLELARQVGPHGRVVGVDVREPMIAEARRRVAASDLPVEFHVGDIYALDLPADSFDGCRADRVFQHLERPEQALAELVRVTRPGGVVVVFDVDWATLVVDAPDQATTRAILQRGCDEHANGWAGRALWRQFHAAGLRDVAVSLDGGAVTDYALADQIFGLRDEAHVAAREGLISAEAAAAWVESLEAAARVGQFFSAVTGFIVAGRKPERAA